MNLKSKMSWLLQLILLPLSLVLVILVYLVAYGLLLVAIVGWGPVWLWRKARKR